MIFEFRISSKIRNGFSLIEILVVMFIISVVFMSFYTVSTVGTKHIIESKSRLAALALVNEKMEIVRNLAYDNVGTQGSIDIPGNILQEEDVVANGKSYNVQTSVRYIDDSEDGTISSSPADEIPNDYKLVRIIVSWIDSNGQTQSVSGTSRFVPPGLETNVGGSPLSINVNSNKNGVISPVSGAVVNISNNNISPVVSDNINTGTDGRVMLPAARIASGYQLVITKAGHETVETMDQTATFIPSMDNHHIDVVTGGLNQYSFEQNELANLHIRSVDYQNNPVSNIGFSMNGGKIIGHDDLGNVVYRMSNTEGNELFGLSNVTGNTGATGEKEYAQISPGSYNVTMNANAQYEFIDFDPSTSPAVLIENDLDYTIKVADKSVPALFLKVSDSVDSAPIAGAQVELRDSLNGEIFSGKMTSQRGIVFYPDSANTLAPGEYTLRVSASGYVTETPPVTINNALTPIEISLDHQN